MALAVPGMYQTAIINTSKYSGVLGSTTALVHVVWESSPDHGKLGLNAVVAIDVEVATLTLQKIYGEEKRLGDRGGGGGGG